MRPMNIRFAAHMLRLASKGHCRGEVELPEYLADDDLAEIAAYANRWNFSGPTPANAHPDDVATILSIRGQHREGWILMGALSEMLSDFETHR